MTHADQIKSAIEKHQVSLRKIEADTGVDRSNLSKMLRGQMPWSSNVVLQLAKYFSMRFTQPKKPAKK